MSGSLSDWLALREPVDHAARSEALARRAAGAVSRLPALDDRRTPVRIVDLGAGTGSNQRYLTRWLPGNQEWLLVDQDADLLSRAAAPGIAVAAQRLDTLDPALFDRRHLVTASALLDLVSASWIRALAAECRRAGAVALFALTYDGRSECTPREPDDDWIRELMNRHQRQNDKGFGRAAGPDAPDAARRAFAAEGYSVECAPSDWMLASDLRELQQQLVEGWADAAREIAPADAARIDRWLVRRAAHIAAGRSRITVGHQDLAAWPVSATDTG